MQTPVQQLTINDLATVRNIIDLAVTRGAFRANEVKIVGETFERLETFLSSLEQAAEHNHDTGHVRNGDTNESQGEKI